MPPSTSAPATAPTPTSTSVPSSFRANDNGDYPDDIITDPTDFEGIEYQFSQGNLPALFPEDQPAAKKDPRSNAATGASAAGMRAFTAQAVAFYFRAPVKAFFRTRVDYLAYARALQNEYVHAQAQIHSHGALTAAPAASRGSFTTRCASWFMPWWRNTTPGLLAFAVRNHGWRVIPEQVMPPLVANVTVGAVLYTSYLQILGRLHEPSGEIRKRVYPPPSVGDTLLAGSLAGGIQSLVAAPLDALQVRYDRRHVNGNGNGNGNGNSTGLRNPLRDKTMWVYGREKLHEIGMRGIFAGWGLSFTKDSLGSGLFFSTFEYVKAQGYYRFVRWYYGALRDEAVDILAKKRPSKARAEPDIRNRNHHGHNRLEYDRPRIIKPHYALEPTFLLLAGVSATLAQQTVIYPLSLIQARHFERLEGLDAQARRILAQEPSARHRGRMARAYYHAYQETWRECHVEAMQALHENGTRNGNGSGSSQLTASPRPAQSASTSTTAHARANASASAKVLLKWLYRGFWWNTIRQVPSTSAGLIIFELVRRKYGLQGDEVRINQDGYDILLS